MKFSIAVTVLSGLAAVTARPAPRATGPPRCNRRSFQQYCEGTKRIAALTHVYLCGDDRLGPARLPERISLDSEFDSYNRLGGLCPDRFLELYWNETFVRSDGKKGGWKYPDSSGFSLDKNNKTIKGTATLKKGVLLDRFGNENGTYVSPAGTPYMQRALPPDQLNVLPGEGIW